MRYRFGLFLILASLIGAGLVGRPATAPAAPHGHAHRAAAAESNPALTALANAVLRKMSGSTARHADYAVNVAGLGSFSRHGNTGTAPASTNKLLTTATLLNQLGSSYSYLTTVYTTGQVVGHTLHGNLVLVGSGDPTLHTSDLRSLARRIHAKGISTVAGHLVVDDSRYGHQTRTTGWKHDFVPDETGPVDAFSVDGNSLERNSAYYRNPTGGNLARWRRVLTRHHVHVSDSSQVGKLPAGATAVATHKSIPLSEIVSFTLTDSVNFYAEMMLREAGAVATGHGTIKSGVAAVRKQATTFGHPVGTMYDGSGLSYADRESPIRLVNWLRGIRSSALLFSPMFTGLPVSCRSGTLEHRLCGKHVAGQVHAKTGTLTRITALAGYTTTRSGRLVTFAFQLSGMRNVSRAMKHLDAAVSVLPRSKS